MTSLFQVIRQSRPQLLPTFLLVVALLTAGAALPANASTTADPQIACVLVKQNADPAQCSVPKADQALHPAGNLRLIGPSARRFVPFFPAAQIILSVPPSAVHSRAPPRFLSEA
jgi:hypothetical protein